MNARDPRRDHPSGRYEAELEIATKVDALGIDEHPDRIRLRKRTIVALAAITGAVYLVLSLEVVSLLGWWPR